MQLHRIPMTKSYDIVGYAFNTDTYCVGDCITQAVGEVDPQSGLTAHVEQALNEIAAERGINRDDERSFDSSEFPKVIFASEEFDYCPRCIVCGGVLDGHDPDDYTDPESE